MVGNMLHHKGASSYVSREKTRDFSTKCNTTLPERRHLPERRLATERRAMFERRFVVERRRSDVICPRFYKDSEQFNLSSEQNNSASSSVYSIFLGQNLIERERKIRNSLHDLGVDWMGYGKSIKQHETWIPYTFLTTYACPEWTEQYFKGGFFRVDPRLKMTFNSFLPYVWDLGDIRYSLRDNDTPLARSFLEKMEQIGVTSGVMFTLPSHRPNERFSISFFSRKASKEWITEEHVSKMLMLGLCVHETYAKADTQQDDGVKNVDISVLEQSILELIARGLPDKQIADKISISQCNLDYHLRQLRKRFGARNRVQLAAIWTMRH